MRDTLKIECLMQAMEEYGDARSEHDAARTLYIESGGYSWGYFGQSYVDRMEAKAEQFMQQLDAYIETKIVAKLAEISAERSLHRASSENP